jgi:hypothetical protein
MGWVNRRVAPTRLKLGQGGAAQWKILTQMGKPTKWTMMGWVGQKRKKKPIIRAKNQKFDPTCSKTRP